MTYRFNVWNICILDSKRERLAQNMRYDVVTSEQPKLFIFVPPTILLNFRLVTRSICLSCVLHCFRTQLITPVFALARCYNAIKSKRSTIVRVKCKNAPRDAYWPQEKEPECAIESRTMQRRVFACGARLLIDFAQRNCSFEQVH